MEWITRIFLFVVSISFISTVFASSSILINAESGAAQSLDGSWDLPCRILNPDQSERLVFLGDTFKRQEITYTSTDGSCSTGEEVAKTQKGTVVATEDFIADGWSDGDGHPVPAPKRQDSTGSLNPKPRVTRLIFTIREGPEAGIRHDFFYMDDTATPWHLYGEGSPDDSSTYSKYVNALELRRKSGRESSFIITLGQSLRYPAFWVGFVLVALFAYNRFAASEAESEAEDPHVVSRSFTTRFRYGLSAIVYISFFEFCFGVLVGIGSLPVLQELLTDWIGSLQFDEKEVGTPAWAALFVTAVLPSAPGFGQVDKNFRKTLHRFASIPYKARGLAREIRENLTANYLELPNSISPVNATDKNFSIRLQVAKLLWLFQAIENLQDVAITGSKAENYSKFFNTDYLSIWNGLKQKKTQIKDWLDTPASAAPVVASECETLLKTTSRFFCCALLLNEPSERSARIRVREQIGVRDLAKLKFDFTLKQIIINIALAFILTFFGSLAALGIALPADGDGITIKMIGAIFFWLPFTALTMVVPFVFTAGLRLYFMDRFQSEIRIPFEDELLGLIFLFIFTFGVGTIPSLLGMLAGNFTLTENWILQVVPSGMTPATVALLFYFLSYRHLVDSKRPAAALDFVVFSATAALVAWVSVKVTIYAGMDIEKVMNIEGITNDVLLIVSPVIHALMVGVTGAIQCSISRANLSSLGGTESINSREALQT